MKDTQAELGKRGDGPAYEEEDSCCQSLIYRFSAIPIEMLASYLGDIDKLIL